VEPVDQQRLQRPQRARYISMTKWATQNNVSEKSVARATGASVADAFDSSRAVLGDMLG